MKENLNKLLKKKLIRSRCRFKNETFLVAEPWIQTDKGIIYLSDGYDFEITKWNSPRLLPKDKCRLLVIVEETEIKIINKEWVNVTKLKVINNKKKLTERVNKNEN
jgi:hypothetical protein